MEKLLLSIMVCSLIEGTEYRFNKIAQIPHSTPFGLVVGGRDFKLPIGDTDHDGLNEIIFKTDYYIEKGERKYTIPWDIWEWRLGDQYVLEYTGPTDTTQGGVPYAVGDIDKDGLSDMIVYYGYGHYEDNCFTGDSVKTVMIESTTPYTYPTEIVWGVKYELAYDPTIRWAAVPIIEDIDKDGRNEYIFTYENYIFIAKCTGDNRIELVDSVQTESPECIFCPVLYDFDGDGKYDLAGTRGPSSLGKVLVYEQSERYKFKFVWKDSVMLSNGVDVFFSKDSDRDGKPEFFISYCHNEFTEGTAWLYRWEATGDNSYSRMLIDSVKFTGLWPARASACGDVDKDGIDEIVWSIGTDVFIYKFTGNDKYEKIWHWEVPRIDSWNGSQAGIRVYDMNKNGYPEIIISVQSDAEKIIEIFEIDTTCLNIASPLSNLPVSQFTISPNPMRKTTTIKYRLTSESPVSLKIYDISGKLAKTLTKIQNPEPKAYTITWDGRNSKGNLLPSGVYFCILETKDSTLFKRKMVIQR